MNQNNGESKCHFRNDDELILETYYANPNVCAPLEYTALRNEACPNDNVDPVSLDTIPAGRLVRLRRRRTLVCRDRNTMIAQRETGYTRDPETTLPWSEGIETYLQQQTQVSVWEQILRLLRGDRNAAARVVTHRIDEDDLLRFAAHDGADGEVDEDDEDDALALETRLDVMEASIAEGKRKGWNAAQIKETYRRQMADDEDGS